MFDDSIKIWIENFLNKTSPTLNNLPPCPFAKQALITNKIKIHEIKPLPHISMKDYCTVVLTNQCCNIAILCYSHNRAFVEDRSKQ